MVIIEDIRAEEPELGPVAVTVGSFDGVHLGHRLILERAAEAARGMNGICAVLTLRPHPRQFFAPETAPSLLTTDRKKLELFEEAGVGAVFFLPFNAEVAALSPLMFVESILCDQCHARAVVVGHDFRFGRGAEGDYDLLARVGPDYNLLVSQVPPLLIDGERVSSTLIRERLLLGDLESAERFLGRKYSITGDVVSGKGVGASLGFPTANIAPHHSAVPAQGVYAAQVVLDGKTHAAAVNIGVAPTVRNESLTVEAFLLDFDGNIQGQEVEVVFHRRLRAERRFPSREALSAQIARDVAEVRQCLAGQG